MKFDIGSKGENLLSANTQSQNFSPKGKGGFKFGYGLNMGKLNIGVKNSFSNFKHSVGGNSFKSELNRAKEKEIETPDEIQKLDTVKIERDDATFFINLIENKNLAQDLVSNNAKQINVSKNLLELLHRANDTKKPVRIDFDNKITLVLKVESDGKLSAQFFPGDKAAEEYLRNNIPFLKQQFDEKEIKYSSLNYHSQREKRRNKDE